MFAISLKNRGQILKYDPTSVKIQNGLIGVMLPIKWKIILRWFQITINIFRLCNMTQKTTFNQIATTFFVALKKLYIHQLTINVTIFLSNIFIRTSHRMKMTWYFNLKTILNFFMRYISNLVFLSDLNLIRSDFQRFYKYEKMTSI